MTSNKANIKLIIDGCLREQTLFQDKLFKLYYGFVMSICVRYASNKDESKEMLNDTFYTVFKNISKYDDQYPLEPWLRRVCINTCLNYKRKYVKEWSKDSLIELNDDTVNGHISLPNAVDLDYLQLLQHLPEACKTIVNLYIIEDYKHHEIAELLNVSVGTSKSNLHRAKQLLYKMLEKDKRGRLKLKSNYGG